MKYLLKTLGYYAIFIILVTFICSLLNLIGVNSTITNLIYLSLNFSILYIRFKNGKKVSSKGYMPAYNVGLFLLV